MANQVVGLRLDDEAVIKLNYLSSKTDLSKADVVNIAIKLLDSLYDRKDLYKIFKEVNTWHLKKKSNESLY